MRCPFGFLGSSAPAPAPNGKCPFAGLLAAPAGPGNNMDKPAEPGLGTRPPTNCPAPDKERSGPAAAAASAATPAVCPYGFGSAAQKDDVLAALQCARYDLQLSHASLLHLAYLELTCLRQNRAILLCACAGAAACTTTRCGPAAATSSAARALRATARSRCATACSAAPTSRLWTQSRSSRVSSLPAPVCKALALRRAALPKEL